MFASARWSLDALGLAVFRVIEPLLHKDTIFLALDDTLARKRGLKVFGVGMHHDPLLSSRGRAIMHWGHSWVVLGGGASRPVAGTGLLFAGFVPDVSQPRSGCASAESVSSATALEVLTWYVLRWSLEVAFHDSKQHLGFEEPPGWSRQAAQRTAPVALLLYSLIVSWFAQEGHRHYRPQTTSWYAKPHASFGDMLATLRRESLREQSFRWGLSGPGSQKIVETLENTLTLAV